MERFDTVIIGGGIFGVYAALFLAKRGERIAIIEREQALMTKASVVNQARLHSGYHYPRSIATAQMSDENKARFTKEHHDFINFSFEKYYAIDRYGSFTDAAQFERFCRFVGLRCDLVQGHPYFNYERLEAIFATTEYTFDPVLIAQYYREQLIQSKDIILYLDTTVAQASSQGNSWLIELVGANKSTIKASRVLNATYAGSNAINRLFAAADIRLMHEISEMVFLTSPQLKDIGLTVMDGPFASIMPYGKSGLLSLSSVAYTHQKVSYDVLPTFDCQEKREDCSPQSSANCSACHFKPRSNYSKMLQQIRQYLTDDVVLHYFNSRYTIKSKLRANYIDDGRPTEVSKLKSNPDFFCVFAGKINSIYELEKVL